MNYFGLRNLFQVTNQINRARCHSVFLARFADPTRIMNDSENKKNDWKLVNRCFCREINTAYFTNSVDGNIFIKLKNKLKFMWITKYKLMAAGALLYECVADNLKYDQFYKKLDLPDTFNSWFLVTELHVWMLLVRAMAEEKEDGRIVRNNLVQALWNDVVSRAPKLGVEHTRTAKSQVSELSHQFQATIVNYDEGLLSDDKVLAGALWRRFFFNKYVHPEVVESLVRYVRLTVFYLDNLSTEDVLKKKIKWLPLEINERNK